MSQIYQCVRYKPVLGARGLQITGVEKYTNALIVARSTVESHLESTFVIKHCTLVPKGKSY